MKRRIPPIPGLSMESGLSTKLLEMGLDSRHCLMVILIFMIDMKFPLNYNVDYTHSLVN
jgi:hypothetical protein